MIQFLADSIDQLDLALDQLAVNDRNFDRFAFLLVDNVVELSLHQYAQDRASENEFWGTLKEPRYDQKAVEEALRQHFESKVKLATKLGMLKQDVGDSILKLHMFRNAAYHRGLRHEGILHSLAIFYFRLACRVLATYKPRYWSWSTADRLSYRAQKYLGSTTTYAPEALFRAAFKRLEDVASALPESLVPDLSADMERTIDQADSAIDFLASNGPEPLTRDAVVMETQAWSKAFSDEGKNFAAQQGFDAGGTREFVDWLLSSYRFPVRTDPIPSWRNRLARLTAEKDYHAALKKYCDFLSQTEQLRELLEEHAAHLDEAIQTQIDIARGK